MLLSVDIVRIHTKLVLNCLHYHIDFPSPSVPQGSLLKCMTPRNSIVRVFTEDFSSSFDVPFLLSGTRPHQSRVRWEVLRHYSSSSLVLNFTVTGVTVSGVSRRPVVKGWCLLGQG